MLRHAFERLEGGNILCLIVGPLPPVPPIFSLFQMFFSPDLVLLPVWLELRHEAKPRAGNATNKGNKTKEGEKNLKEREKRVGRGVGRGVGTHNQAQYS